MTGNVVNFGGITKLPTDPKRILEAAAEKEWDQIIILGFTADGEESYSSSHPDVGDVIYHLERCKHRLMTILDGMQK